MIRPKIVVAQESQMSEEMKAAQDKAIAAYADCKNVTITAEVANVAIDAFNSLCDTTGFTSLKRVRM